MRPLVLVLLAVAAARGAEAPALDRLGIIRAAIVVYPPYEGIHPTVTFEFREAQPGMTSRVRSVRVGQTLIPKRYKFVGCEEDPKTGITLFLFDVFGDGKRIEKLRWKLARPSAKKKKKRRVEKVRGVHTPTRAGWGFLFARYTDILDDVETAPHREPRGLKVVHIPKRSVANKFGVRPGDIIVSVNGHTVTDKKRLVAVVQAELKHKVLSVRIRRDGKTLEQLYDTRKPKGR